MPKFNLDDYEMVKDRIPLFLEKYPDGRINTEVISETSNAVTMKAYLYKSLEEQASCAPLSTGIAREIEGGFIDKYYENCETSAIGRALANINLYNGDRPSFEEMNSAKSMKETKNTNSSRSEAPKTSKKDIVISDPGSVATEKQAIWLKRFAQANIINYDDVFDEDGNVIITKGLASDMMDDAFPKYNEWQEKKKKES